MSYCIPNPCLNNGTCVSRDSGYICCSENYSVGDCRDQGQSRIIHFLCVDKKLIYNTGQDSKKVIGLSAGLGVPVIILLIVVIVACALLLFILKNRSNLKREQKV